MANDRVVGSKKEVAMMVYFFIAALLIITFYHFVPASTLVFGTHLGTLLWAAGSIFTVAYLIKTKTFTSNDNAAGAIVLVIMGLLASVCIGLMYLTKLFFRLKYGPGVIPKWMEE
jgi:hypothetical protein